MFWESDEKGHHIVDTLNTTELYTLKLLIVCYVNFTSVIQRKRGEKSQHQHHTRFVFAHDEYKYIYIDYWASRVALLVKNPSANAGDIRDPG